LSGGPAPGAPGSSGGNINNGGIGSGGGDGTGGNGGIGSGSGDGSGINGGGGGGGGGKSAPSAATPRTFRWRVRRSGAAIFIRKSASCSRSRSRRW